MSAPSDEEIREGIRVILPEVNLRNTGLKKFVKLLSKKMRVDLKPQAPFIKQVLTEAINAMASEEEQSDNNEASSSEEDEPAKRVKPKKGGGGLMAPKEISDALAAFLGKGKQMPRTEIVKLLWVYIREHELQNPENKREIFLDDAMKSVFGCTKMTMFTMNKYISAHVEPYKPVDLTSSPSKKRKSPAAKSSEKKKRKVGTQPPYRLSPELTDVLGKEVLPRPQVVSGLWVYIKANDLQNPTDRREILCDDKLKLIFKGQNKVTMFNMNQFITAHLIEKIDPKLYHHEAAGSDADE